jgi:hypothetical protein
MKSKKKTEQVFIWRGEKYVKGKRGIYWKPGPNGMFFGVMYPEPPEFEPLRGITYYPYRNAKCYYFLFPNGRILGVPFEACRKLKSERREDFLEGFERAWYAVKEWEKPIKRVLLSIVPKREPKPRQTNLGLF